MASTAGRLRAWLTAAGVLSALVAVPGAFAAAPGRLELTGSRAASVEITIRRGSELLDGGFRMTTKGTYAGLAVLDSTGRVQALAMNVQTWIDARPSAAGTPVSSLNPFEKTVLKPGRYRLLLLTDGPSRVSVPATGELRRSIRATRPYDDDVRVEDVSGPVDGIPANDAVVPADFRKSRYAIVAHHRETKALQAQVTSFCLAPSGSRHCTPTQEVGGTHVLQNVGAQPGDGWARSELYAHTYLPEEGYDFRGLYDARFSDVSADLPQDRYALIVVI